MSEGKDTGEQYRGFLLGNVWAWRFFRLNLDKYGLTGEDKESKLFNSALHFALQQSMEALESGKLSAIERVTWSMR